jgi:exopolysaccharide biosynthesis polyprenyl glycosylphosphotransferase
MSSLPLSSEPQKPQGAAWAARLIPGAALHGSRKKLPRSAGLEFSFREAVAPTRLETADPGIQNDQHSKVQHVDASKNWLISTLIAWARVMLIWLVIAWIGIQVHLAFPNLLLATPLPGTIIPRTLLSLAFLHGVLINLLNSRNRALAAPFNLAGEMRRLSISTFWGTLVLSVALQMQGCSFPMTIAVWSVGGLYFFASAGWLWIGRNSRAHYVRTSAGTRNVLIVGADTLGRQIASHMGKHPELGRTVCGFLDDRKPLGGGVVGRTSNLIETARSAFVDEIILTAPQSHELIHHVLQAARQLRLDLKIAPELFGCRPAEAIENLGGIPLISLHEEKLPAGELLLKRALDFASATVALILLAPALILISILIKIDSRGPVLYVASRGGRKGKPFLCYKFRTMVSDADDRKDGLRTQNERAGPFFKITDDPRVTRIGKFLRRYSLDELPQLWNVARGEMSMVGPRPHPLDDVSAYGIEHLARLDVVPGITGLWQVTARQDPSFETGMRLDMEYIRCWSLKMDLHILLKTAGAVLRGSGT